MMAAPVFLILFSLIAGSLLWIAASFIKLGGRFARSHFFDAMLVVLMLGAIRRLWERIG